MKPHNANLLNAAVLIIMSAWGYYSSETPSMTALIPAIIGGILLACNGGVKKENKVIAHVAVVVTLLGILGLIKPLMGVIERENTMGMIRVIAMMITGVLAMVAFIKSFRDARIAREAGNK